MEPNRIITTNTLNSILDYTLSSDNPTKGLTVKNITDLQQNNHTNVYIRDGYSNYDNNRLLPQIAIAKEGNFKYIERVYYNDGINIYKEAQIPKFEHISISRNGEYPGLVYLNYPTTYTFLGIEQGTGEYINEEPVTRVYNIKPTSGYGIVIIKIKSDISVPTVQVFIKDKDTLEDLDLSTWYEEDPLLIYLNADVYGTKLRGFTFTTAPEDPNDPFIELKWCTSISNVDLALLMTPYPDIFLYKTLTEDDVVITGSGITKWAEPIYTEDDELIYAHVGVNINYNALGTITFYFEKK